MTLTEEQQRLERERSKSPNQTGSLSSRLRKSISDNRPSMILRHAKQMSASPNSLKKTLRKEPKDMDPKFTKLIAMINQSKKQNSEVMIDNALNEWKTISGRK